MKIVIDIQENRIVEPQPVCGTLYIPDLRPALDQEFSHNNLLHMNIEEENSMCVETDQENATNCEEHPNNDSNVTKKGIKIISDILINRSNDTDKSDIKSGESITEYDKEEEKELEIVSEDKVEEPLSKLGMEELDKPAQVNQIEASENKTEQSFSKRVLENESATLKKIEEVDVAIFKHLVGIRKVFCSVRGLQEYPLVLERISLKVSRSGSRVRSVFYIGQLHTDIGLRSPVIRMLGVA
ncbi:hypothetical protein GEV33_004709 [Tenebrio molitor]|uniref:Uncharacterized protein n=1 Tax=Tenebrio molitor TaxID=7067 RepID=A0A8J6HPM5_TENMO|nr:hypothetical protein GEV33_004709 [Tenebrio molitor]